MSFGAVLMLFGVLSIILNFFDMNFSILMWMDMWGNTIGWILRILFVIVGLIIWANTEDEGAYIELNKGNNNTHTLVMQNGGPIDENLPITVIVGQKISENGKIEEVTKDIIIPAGEISATFTADRKYVSIQ